VSSNHAFKALGDPTRREILGLLRHGEKTAGELAEHFDMTKPSMSHHFAVLKEADLDWDLGSNFVCKFIFSSTGHLWRLARHSQ